MTARSGATVLMLENDPGLVRAAKRQLKLSGLHVHATNKGSDVLPEIRRLNPDVILLELSIPDVDGVGLIQAIRQISPTQIIAFAEPDDDARKVQALDAGADDCLTKPFSLPELEARVRVAIRHAAGQSHEMTLSAGRLTLDLVRHAVTADGELLHLTQREFALCRLLVQRQERVVATETLLATIWSRESEPCDTHVLRTCVSELRAKLRGVVRIVNEPGIGYRLEVPADSAGAPRRSAHGSTPPEAARD